jgi:hypothetical protein
MRHRIPSFELFFTVLLNCRAFSRKAGLAIAANCRHLARHFDAPFYPMSEPIESSIARLIRNERTSSYRQIAGPAGLRQPVGDGGSEPIAGE